MRMTCICGRWRSVANQPAKAGMRPSTFSDKRSGSIPLMPRPPLIGEFRREQSKRGVQLSREEIAEALHFARHALAVGRDDPDALRMAGPALAVLGGELAAAMSALDRATTLNPNSAQAWREYGVVNCFANRPDAAIATAQRAMRLTLSIRSVIISSGCSASG